MLEPPPTMPLEGGIPFDQIALERGYLVETQLEECRTLQREMEEKGITKAIEQILVEKGYMTPVAVRHVLEEQEVRSSTRARIGNYRIIEKIGEGGMGAVYKAEMESTGAVVALKVLPPRLAADGNYIERFRREAEIASGLDHPNLVRALRACFDSGLHYFAMEYVDGETVQDRLDRDEKIGEAESLNIIRQVAMALDHAFAADLVHRDIKPDNIIMTKGKRVKLSDMGLAKFTNDSVTRLTQSGVVVGTVHYVSPEQARGDRDIDVRSDIYSLGATLYHLVTGEVPFDADSAIEVLNMHLDEPVPWPADVNPDVSEATSELIEKMMSKKPGNRPQSPKDVIRLLDGVVEEHGFEVPSGHAGLGITGRRRAARGLSTLMRAFPIPSVSRKGLNFGRSKVTELAGGKVELMWDFKHPLDPDAWYLSNVLPDDAGRGHVNLSFPGPITSLQAPRATLSPRIAFRGGVEVEATFSELEGFYGEAKKGLPALTLTVCSAATEPRRGPRSAFCFPFFDTDVIGTCWGVVEVSGPAWPKYHDVATKRALKIVVKGGTAEAFLMTRKEKWQSVGKTPFRPTVVGVEVGLAHRNLQHFSARVDSLRIVGRPIQELTLPDAALGVHRAEDAAAQFRQARVIAKRSPNGWCHPDARAACRAQILYFPKDIKEIHKALAMLVGHGSPGEAIELWNNVSANFDEKEAVEHDCLLQVGWAHRLLGGKKEALLNLRKGRNAKPSYCLMLGRSMVVFGEQDEAIREWRRAVTRWPDSKEAPRAQMAMAETYLRKGDLRNASRSYEKVLSKWPGDHAARREAERGMRRVNEMMETNPDL